MKNKEPVKIAEIGPYPPPNSGWSVRIKKLKQALVKDNCKCKALNLGQNRKIKSDEYIDVQSGTDYIRKLFMLKLKGYDFHLHTNAQAEKGPVLILIAHLVSLLFFKRAALTFHGGYQQIYFPKNNGGKMYFIIFLNFLFSKIIICNDNAIKNNIAVYGPMIAKAKIYPIQAFSLQYIENIDASLPEEIEKYIREKKYLIISYLALRKGYYIDVLIEYLKDIPEDTGAVITGISKIEDYEISELYDQLKELHKQKKILITANLDHDQFLSLMNKSDLYLRTYISDGVASSVLEALAVGTVVVASDNGRRPEGVITYQADDSDDMKQKIEYALNNIEKLKGKIIKPEIPDTVKEEVELLKSAFEDN